MTSLTDSSCFSFFPFATKFGFQMSLCVVQTFLHKGFLRRFLGFGILNSVLAYKLLKRRQFFICHRFTRIAV